MQGKWFSITVLAVCEVAALALWFSATAVVPALSLEYDLSSTQASLLTSSVQAGFVAGALLSALLGLADRFDPRRLFMLSTLIACAGNGAILLIEPVSPLIFGLRFLTGVCMAGIYPVGMKIAASWAKGDIGFLVGLLVGAITLGSAAPHFFNALGGINWRFTIAGASLVALAAALAINLVRLGPALGAAPPFDLRNAFKAYTTRSLRLANFGYLGHMWELFAMWAWIGVFLEESFRISLGAEPAQVWARYATFVVMGVGGAVGCLGAGLLADKLGRTTITMAAMLISGTCALVTGFLFAAPPLLLFIVCLIWGISIVADSAQFSAAVTELSEPELIGTMLTMQTSVGFLLTLITIHLMPVLVAAGGWGLAFAALAIGPFLGVLAMARLRGHPDAIKLAGGRR